MKQISRDLFEDKTSYIKNEIETQQQFKHPNICELKEVILTRDNLYMVLEYCHQNLSRYMRARSFTEMEVYDITCQLLSGLNAIYEKNILHRDLKPGNILVDITNRAHHVFKIADFGIAR
jgi:serine/threonine protein kinase